VAGDRGDLFGLENVELKLDSPGEKNAAAHDAQGMAAGGGGVIIYGVDEIELARSGRESTRAGTLGDRPERAPQTARVRHPESCETDLPLCTTANRRR
jgi:hypothetical protein